MQRTRSSATNVIIAAKDHAAVQINVADVDPNTGVALSTYKVYVFSGALRAQVRLGSLLSPEL